MGVQADLGALAEIAGRAETLEGYEREALDVIGRRVGFDVAMWKRPSGLGPYAPGLDPKIRAACAPDLHEFGRQLAQVAEVAAAEGGVAVDLDVLGLRRMERLSYYQRLMRPHGGTSTAMLYFTHRRRPIGALALGRTRGSFAGGELTYLRALVPTLAMCEAATASSADPPARDLAALRALTPREREVLGYLRHGYTNAQIATALGSAERTVRNQLSSVYEKLGIATRTEAAALAIELGLR
jgi:DNA-binding CsgD family transcriptional regulator